MVRPVARVASPLMSKHFAVVRSGLAVFAGRTLLRGGRRRLQRHLRRSRTWADPSKTSENEQNERLFHNI